MKTCSKCGEEKLEELFPKQRTLCRPCWSLYRKAFREREKESIKGYMQEYRQRSTSKERKRELDREYYKNNKEKVTLVNSIWYSRNRTKMLKYKSEWYQANKERCSRNSKIWEANNRERVRELSRAQSKRNLHKELAKTNKRRTLKLKAIPKWANDFFIEEAYALAKLRTELTGFKWHVDHIVPLKSDIVCGLHCEQNLQVIPAIENIMKSNKYWPNMPEESLNGN